MTMSKREDYRVNRIEGETYREYRARIATQSLRLTVRLEQASRDAAALDQIAALLRDDNPDNPSQWATDVLSTIYDLVARSGRHLGPLSCELCGNPLVAGEGDANFCSPCTELGENELAAELSSGQPEVPALTAALAEVDSFEAGRARILPHLRDDYRELLVLRKLRDAVRTHFTEQEKTP
jgi:hypothetical protein